MVGVVFFYGTSLPALLVRLRTKRRGQKWADVPSHVGIIAGTNPAYYEAIVSGVHRLPVRYQARALWLRVPNEAATAAYLEDQVGDPYDWTAIVDDTVGRNLPTDLLFDRRRKAAHDCSGLVTDALLVGGVAISRESLPETPNDLQQALRSLKTSPAL